MAAERDLELLDDYLTNRLNAEERAQFENRLNQDPELQHEYTFQRSIAEGLRTARRTELKAMLNNVPVPPIGGTPSLVKWAGGVTVAVIIGIGIYFFLTPEPPVQEAAKPIIVPPVVEQDETTPEPAAAETTTVSPSEPEARKSSTPVTSVEPKISEQPATRIQAYDPSADQEDAGENTNQPEAHTGEAPAPPAPLSTEVIKTNPEYQFHYQLKGDHVILYGNFDNEPFTILDFRDEGKAYLFYKNAYYLMTENATVKALSPVNDPVLLNKLRSKRNN